MNLTACARLATTPENRVWYRANRPMHFSDALATSHTVGVASRFSRASEPAAGYPILYLAENHHVALVETGALLTSPDQQLIPNPSHAWVVLNVQVVLQTVADLTLVSQQRKLRTTVQELTGDWRGYQLRRSTTSVQEPRGDAPTQLLGAALHGLPMLEGFRSISARAPTQMILVIFPDKLPSGSRIVFHEPGTGQTHSIMPRRPRRQRR